jgi:hypothetical protein
MKPLKTVDLRANTLPSPYASSSLPLKHLNNQPSQYRKERKEMIRTIGIIDITALRYTVREA